MAIRALSEQEIVERALELIAAKGVDALSMRELAGQLGVSLGATYHHVPTKDALLALCGEELYRRALIGRAADEDPVVWVRDQVMRVYDQACSHPGMGPLMRAPGGGAEQAVLGIHEALQAAGLSEELEGRVRFVLGLYMVGALRTAHVLRSKAKVRRHRADVLQGLEHILEPASALAHR